MNLTLHWPTALPGPISDLLGALELLPEVEHAPDVEVQLCPDATQLAPPNSRAGLVAFVGGIERLRDDAGRRQLVAALTPWIARDAILIAPHRKDADDLAALLGVRGDRVRPIALPLPERRRPAPAATGGKDIVLIDEGVAPDQLDSVLRAVSLAKRLGADTRLVLPGAIVGGLGLPGSSAGAYDLLGGHDVVAVEDWRAGVDDAAALLMLGVEQTRAQTLREALATGVPVVAPAGNALSGHLDAIGAPAYPYGPDIIQLAEALVAAVGGHRGAGLGAAAREAVLAESPALAALALLGALVDAAAARNAPFAMPFVATGAAAGDGVHIGIINPHPSAGGGERFLRRLVGAMAEHPSRPRITLVLQEDPLRNFDAGLDELRALGVAVHQAPANRLEAVFEQFAGDRDVTYYPWPHHAFPLQSDKPLVCTFHDVNWRHFDFLPPEMKARLEEQTPVWLEQSDAVVHSAHVVAAEVRRFFGDDYDAHVIPLTADLGADTVSDEERDALRRRHALPEKFVFSPAGRHLHKNYPALSAACRLLREQGRPVSVVATGAVTDTTFHGPDLIGLGYVGERDVSVLYDMSCGVVQTTLYEAGSWPMLEAADAGKPSACSRIPSIVEQVERLGLDTTLFDPTSITEIADALWAMANVPQDAAVLAANRAKVRSLEWSDTAAAYVDVFTGVVEARRAADEATAAPTPITRVRPALIGAQ